MYDTPDIPSQFMRKIIAEELGNDIIWDWKKFISKKHIYQERARMDNVLRKYKIWESIKINEDYIPIKLGREIEITMKRFKKIAESYTKLWFESSVMKSYRDMFLTRLIGESILDAGCGPGHDSDYFISNNKNVVGIDISEEMLQIARNRVNRGIFIKMDIRNQIFSNNQFNGIWVNSVIVHFSKIDVEITLKELKRILRPKGILFINARYGVGEQ